MKRNNQQTIGEAINEMLRVFGLQQKLDETKLISSWEKVMGKTIAKHTTRLYISKKKLFIHLNSSAARQTLSVANIAPASVFFCLCSAQPRR